MSGGGYVPLWCRSNFSFLEGASHPDELVEEAHRLGLTAIALTDRDGVYGMVSAHTKARELGVQLIGGATVTVAAEGARLVPSPVGETRAWGLHHGEEGVGEGEGEAEVMAPMSGARRGRAKRAKKTKWKPVESTSSSTSTSTSTLLSFSPIQQRLHIRKPRTVRR